MWKRVAVSTTCWLICLCAGAVPFAEGRPAAQDETLPYQDTGEDLSLTALMNLKISLAAKTEQTVSEAPSIVAVITGEEIRQMGARSFEDIFRMIGGFDTVLNPSTSNQGIAVRGVLSTNATNNTLKFFLNGHAIHSGPGSSPHHFLDYLPVSNIEKIEIIRGPGSALYGANAFLAVINIITKDYQTPRELRVEGGSLNSQRPTLFWTFESDKLQGTLTLSYLSTDGERRLVESDAATLFFGPEFTAAPANTTNDAENFTAHTDINYGNWHFQAMFNRMNENYAIGVASALTDENKVEIDGGFLALGYKRSFAGDRVGVTFDVYHNFFDFKPNFEIFSEETAALFNAIYAGGPSYAEGEGVIGRPGVKIDLSGAEIAFDYQAHENLSILGGFLYDASKVYDPIHIANGNVTNQPLLVEGQVFGPFQPFGHLVDLHLVEGGNWISEADRVNKAFYLQGMVDLRQAWGIEQRCESFALTLGVRHDDYDDIGNSTNPRVGLVYSPRKSLFFKALYGEAFRAPNFDELYQINNPAFLGNRALEPEDLTTIELQAGFQFHKRFLGTVSYFDTEITDTIQLVPREDGIGTEFRNVGEIRSRGFELEARLAFENGSYGFVNVTFQDAENTTRRVIEIPTVEGEPVTCDLEPHTLGNVPDTIVNLGANAVLSPTFNWNLTLNHTSERERTGELTFQGLEALTIQEIGPCPTDLLVPVDPRPPTPERTLINSALTMHFFQGFEIQLAGFNLLDEDHRDPDNTMSVLNDVPRARRTFWLSFSYAF